LLHDLSFKHTAPTPTYTLSLHDALPIFAQSENKPAVLKSLAKGLHLSKVEQAVEGYESLPLLYSRRIYPTVEGVRNVIRLLGTTDRKSTRLNSSHVASSYAVFCLKKKKK